MAIKKTRTRIEVAPFLIPEGLTDLPTPILLHQKSTGMIWANTAFEREFGKANPQRFQAKAPLGLVHERPVHFDLLCMMGRHEGFCLDKADGTKAPVELKINAYGNPSAEVFLILVEDVSHKVDLEKQLIQHHFDLQKAYAELKQTQTALVQTAKLASLGELSSGIAHELNQPLQAILGFSQELEYVEPLSPTGKEFVGDIISATKKMAEIIRSLRSFARESGDEYSDTSVEHAIREASHLMHHQLMQKGIELEIETPTGLPMIQANPIQLEQVFVNLFSNARDAIDSAHEGHGKIHVCIHSDDTHLTVSVKDDGCGMSDAVKEKIFDPFFTTKEVGKGTGLGLSITYGILKKIGAETEINSRPNAGTEFVIKFKHNYRKAKGEAS